MAETVEEFSPESPPGVGSESDQDIFSAVNTWRAILHADKRRIFDDKGRVKAPSEWEDREALAVASYSPTEAAKALSAFRGGAETVDPETAALVELFMGLSRAQKRAAREFFQSFDQVDDDDEFEDAAGDDPNIGFH